MKAGWDLIRREIRLDPPTPIGKYLGCGHSECKIPRSSMALRTAASSELLLTADRRTNSETSKPIVNDAGGNFGALSGMRYEMLGFMEQCVERYLDLSGAGVGSLKAVATPGVDDHSFNPDDWNESGKLASIAAKVIMKILYAARMYRFDLLHSVNSLARDITRWCRACDNKLHRLISYIHHTKTTCWRGAWATIWKIAH